MRSPIRPLTESPCKRSCRMTSLRHASAAGGIFSVPGTLKVGHAGSCEDGLDDEGSKGVLFIVAFFSFPSSLFPFLPSLVSLSFPSPFPSPFPSLARSARATISTPKARRWPSDSCLACPKSKSPILPRPSTSIFPGCPSAWNNPSPSSILPYASDTRVSTIRFAALRRIGGRLRSFRDASLFGSAKAVRGEPSKKLMARTWRRTNPGILVGIDTEWRRSRRWDEIVSMIRASRRKSNSSVIWRRSSSTGDTRSNGSSVLVRR
mmetsp:Transcript_26986/g.49657  ORF Transcript_26986/g.49657 Transcript_26986/m.49657 type:complete len:263 (+) Transcript_26986:345-1133(+)